IASSGLFARSSRDFHSETTTRTQGHDQGLMLLLANVLGPLSPRVVVPAGTSLSGSLLRIKYFPNAVATTVGQFARWTWNWSRASMRSGRDNEEKSCWRLTI